MKYSLSELVDRLSIVNLKLWHLQENIETGREEGVPEEKLAQMCDQVVSLNKLRERIMEGVEEWLEEAKQDG